MQILLLPLWVVRLMVRVKQNTLISIAGGVKEGLLIKKGEIIKKVKQEEMVQTLKDEILKMVG